MKKILSTICIISMLFFLFACDDIELTLREPIQSNPFEDEIDTEKDIDPIDEDLFPFERLFNDEVKKSITIRISQTQWDLLDTYKRDYYNRYGTYRDDRYVLSDVIFEDEDGVLEIPYVGLRTRGNLSRGPIQNSDGTLNLTHFKLSFDRTFDLSSDTELYQTLKDRRIFGLEEIDMKFNRNYESTFISEKYAFDLMRSFHVHAQYTTLAKVYVEIEGVKTFYGMYTLFEPIDIHFLERRFEGLQASGDLYKNLWQQFGPASLLNSYHQDAIGVRNVQENYRPAYDLKTNKRENDHDALKQFIHLINTLDDQLFDLYISSSFDVLMFLRLMALNVMIGNPDDYRAMGNNYYLYHNPVHDYWYMFPYDFDHGFGQGWDGLEHYSLELDVLTWGRISPDPNILADRILAIPFYQQMYLEYLSELSSEEGLFHIDAYLHLYHMQKNLYDQDLENALQQLRFDLREIENYYDQKLNQVRTQLEVYLS